MGSFHPADQLPRRQCSKKPLNTMRERGPKGPPVPDPNGSCSASGGAQRPPPPQDGRLLRGDAAARHLQQLPLRGGGPAAPRRVPRRRHWPRRGLPYRAPPPPRCSTWVRARHGGPPSHVFELILPHLHEGGAASQRRRRHQTEILHARNSLYQTPRSMSL